MEIKYQKFVDELERIQKEELDVKKLYMNEFLFDIDTILQNCGVNIEESIDPKSLNVHHPKPYKGDPFLRTEIIKIYWIYKKDCGFYLKPYERDISIQIYEIGFDKKGRRITNCLINNLTPDKVLLNNKVYTDIKKVIKKLYNDRKEKAIKDEVKRDVYKYNL